MNGWQWTNGSHAKQWSKKFLSSIFYLTKTIQVKTFVRKMIKTTTWTSLSRFSGKTFRHQFAEFSFRAFFFFTGSSGSVSIMSFFLIVRILFLAIILATCHCRLRLILFPFHTIDGSCAQIHSVVRHHIHSFIFKVVHQVLVLSKELVKTSSEIAKSVFVQL